MNPIRDIRTARGTTKLCTGLTVVGLLGSLMRLVEFLFVDADNKEQHVALAILGGIVILPIVIWMLRRCLV